MAEFVKIAALTLDQGIKVVLRKGLYMTLNVYNDFGTRPSVDLDIAVRKEDWDKTVSVLEDDGWVSALRADPHRMSLSQTHAHAFVKGNFELDLHYDFVNCRLNKVTKVEMWSQLNQADGFNCLSKSNELYLTLIHGFEPNNVISPIRWVVDCVLLFRQFIEADWSAMANLLAEERKKSVFIMLDYLSVNEFISFPNSIQEQLDQLENMKFDLVERASLAKFSVNGFWGFRRLCATIYNSSSKSFKKSLIKGFDHYMYTWNKRSYLEVILHAIMISSDKVLHPNRKRMDNAKK